MLYILYILHMYKPSKYTNITVYLYIYMLYDSMTKTSMTSTLWHYVTTRSTSYAHISMVSTRIPAISCVLHPLARSRLTGPTTWITRSVIHYYTAYIYVYEVYMIAIMYIYTVLDLLCMHPHMHIIFILVSIIYA